MRLAPVPIFYRHDIARAMQCARLSSLVTHQGEEAAECCRLLAYIICTALNHPNPQERNAEGKLVLLENICADARSAKNAALSATNISNNNSSSGMSEESKAVKKGGEEKEGGGGDAKTEKGNDKKEEKDENSKGEKSPSKAEVSKSTAAAAGFYSPLYSVQCLACSEQEREYGADGKLSQISGGGKPVPDRDWNWRQKDYQYSVKRATQQPGYIGSYAMDGEWY